jgi:hypothetical protein
MTEDAKGADAGEIEETGKGKERRVVENKKMLRTVV